METPKAYGNETEIRPECLRAYSDGWQQPTKDEVRAVLNMAGLTGAAAASLVGIADSRTVRRWTGGVSPIPYSAWALLCHAAGFGEVWKFRASGN